MDPRINDFDTSDLLTTLDTMNEILDSEEFYNMVWVGV